jgi:hypothetical protein
MLCTAFVECLCGERNVVRLSHVVDEPNCELALVSRLSIDFILLPPVDVLFDHVFPRSESQWSDLARDRDAVCVLISRLDED